MKGYLFLMLSISIGWINNSVAQTKNQLPGITVKPRGESVNDSVKFRYDAPFVARVEDFVSNMPILSFKDFKSNMPVLKPGAPPDFAKPAHPMKPKEFPDFTKPAPLKPKE
jgi:hypothetical protein